MTEIERKKLDDKFYEDLDSTIYMSEFWKFQNHPDDYHSNETEIVDIEHIDVVQTDAAHVLGSMLNDFFQEEDDSIVIAVDTPDPDLNPGTVLNDSYPGFREDIVVGAEAGLTPEGIRLVILYLATFGDNFNPDDIDHEFASRTIGATIRHELIHFSQYDKRVKRQGISRLLAKQAFEDEGTIAADDRGEKYFGSHIEIDAYSHEIAEELLLKVGHQGALDILRHRRDVPELDISRAAKFYLSQALSRESNNKFLRKIHSEIENLVSRGIYETVENLLREHIRCLLLELPGDDPESVDTKPAKPFEKDKRDSLVQFIILSNEIEGYTVEQEDVETAVDGIIQGYPAKYVTNDPHIYSHLAGLIASTKTDPKSVDGAIKIHRALGPNALESGVPGTMRSHTGTSAKSDSGVEYTPPREVGDAMYWWESQKFHDPFEAHVVYELIHPFNDGNGRSGRIILAAMSNYDFDQVNQQISSDYFSRLESFSAKYGENFWKDDPEYNPGDNNLGSQYTRPS